MDKKNRGQFFTVNQTVQSIMVELIHDKNDSHSVLEPSAGAGDLMRAVAHRFPQKTVVGYELDDSIKPVDESFTIQYGDFFDTIGNGNKFHTIIGNPPYVAWKNVEESVKMNAAPYKQNYSDKTNLYYLFIDACIDLLEDDGEMIFIVPKEWLYTTSARPLRNKIMSTGKITHFVDGGEEKVFPDADVPAIIIYRYVKTKTNSDHYSISYRDGFVKGDQSFHDKTLYISDNDYWAIMDNGLYQNIQQWGGKTVGDFFDVKVGLVTGADAVYNVSNSPAKKLLEAEGTVESFVTTKGVEDFIDVNDYNDFSMIPEHTQNFLLEHKDKLINRRITKFTENNWWKYGAIRNKSEMLSDKKRVFVFGRTRSVTPFFINDAVKFFGGGILCLFYKENNSVPEKKVLDYLNSSMFRDYCVAYGITTSNKVSFQPSTLENLPFPSEEFLNRNTFS